MKLTIIFLIVGCLEVSAKTYSQKITLKENNVSLQRIFEEIQKQTDYHFFYADEMLSAAKKVSVNINKGSIEEVLNFCLRSQPLTYVIIENTIIIKRKMAIQAIRILSSEPPPPPPVEVHGNVKDENGNPLANASVTIKGTKRGVTTDASGNFAIRVPGIQTILIISYTGYRNQEILVDDQALISISLVREDNSLNEIVVTALGITKAVKSLTYSVQEVKSDELNKTTGVNVINSLQGKIAGLTITRSTNGVAGGSTVLLRGNRSITGNNAPLYITDGVPGDIGMVDEDNIESISVLKGAAAAALYGSAGQNGVIIVTTKKGKSGKTTLQYNGGIIFDRADILTETQDQYGQGDAGMFVPSSEHSWGPKAEGQTITLWNGNSVPLKAQPNRFDDFFRTGTTFNNSLNISTGTDKMQMYFSYGNITAQGIMRNNNLERHNLNLRIRNNFSNNLSVDSKITYSYESVDNNPVSYAITSIYRTPVSIPINEMQKFEYTDNNGDQRQNYWKPGSSIIGNPYFYMYRNLNHSNTYRIVGLVSARYQFNNWLSVQLRGNVNQSFSDQDEKIYSDSYFSLIGSNYTMGNSNFQSSNVDGLLSFKRDLSKNFNLSGNIGGAIQGSRVKGSTSNANGLNKPNFFYIGNAMSPQSINTFSQSPLLQSLYLAATVSYKNYLFLDVTGRNDWSSALPKGHEAIFYPSVGFSAIISDMVKLPSWVSFGKARLSLANAGSGGEAYFGKEYYTLGIGGIISTPTIQSFNNYKPELTSSFEAAVDWRFFNNRLGFDITYYETETKNQLLLIGAPSASTYDQRYINAGLIRNSGIELILNMTPIKTRNFKWDAMINFSKNNNKVAKITDEMKSVIIQDDDILTLKVEEGKSFGTIYVKGWKRDQQGIKLVDNQGRPQLTPGKTVYAGNYNPDFMAGMRNSFTYSNFSLGFQIDYRNGGTIIGGTQALMDADGHSKRSLEGRENGIILDANTADGTKNKETITSQSYFSAIGDRKPAGEEYAYSATNIRLREASLGYRIPISSNSKSFIKSAQLSLIGRNLFFFKNDAPFDPDIAQSRGGREYIALPFTHSYGVSVKIAF